MNCPICNNEFKCVNDDMLFELQCHDHYTVTIMRPDNFIYHYFYFNSISYEYIVNKELFITHNFSDVLFKEKKPFQEYIDYCKRLYNLKAFL